ncbi:MAG: phage terminase large subunit [Fimbriimonadaceae bacterium]|nr:phage terminase large subunit [Fimbriimonadaceae bacterium]QYK58020.1 MAG: phage terminase large subunit [Fimbriimonadaceae bacterium]
MVEALQLVADGEIKRLLINVPPRVGKTEIVGRLFPAYFLARRPHLDVGLASYAAEIVYDVNKDARHAFLSGGGAVDPAMRLKRRWATTEGGSSWAAGVGGAIRGRGYHLGICDDPNKDTAEVLSEARRARFERWWSNTWENRRQLFGGFDPAQVVVMQRLDPADATGWLLGRPDARSWTVLALDAVRSVDRYPYPEFVPLLPDWRRPGEPLDELVFDPATVSRLMLDEEEWLAQYQQRPRPQGGAVLRREWFAKRIDARFLPPLVARVLGVDLALTTSESADYTVAFPLGLGYDGMLYLFRPYRERAEAPDAEDGVAGHALAHRCTVIAVESTAYQLSFVQRLQRRADLAGVSVVPAPVDRDKMARAKGWAPMAAAGRFVLVEDGSGWVETFLEEASAFPRKRKDQIDALGTAVGAVRERSFGVGGAVVG